MKLSLIYLFFITKKEIQITLYLFGAEDRNRTGTVSLPQDFKSCASACSATSARFCCRRLTTKLIIYYDYYTVNIFFSFFYFLYNYLACFIIVILIKACLRLISKLLISFLFIYQS